MHPEHRADVPGRLEDVVAIAPVPDGELDVITQLDIEAVRVAQQQARAHPGATQHPDRVNRHGLCK